MNFYEKFIEYDYNPFILFNKNGKIISVNQEAQYLLGYVTSSELYQLALNYANTNYGFKTTFVDLEFERFKFFAICVGYENDEEIGLRLYRYPEIKIVNFKDNNTELVNIYALIDLCISANSTKLSANFIKDIDPTLPEIKTNTEKFIKLLNAIFEKFQDSKTIKLKLYMKTGEYIKIENRKFSIFAIEISGDFFQKENIDKLKTLASSINSYIDTTSKSITINIPMITS
ncbi:hypothetical protein [Nitrosophilus kaiyonis]|uniref:hypothetical protein n=1 Tax=Nitrosophilus kaiyonis TaxID=2930200 RepID=UPI0024927A2B|nr:hypothetical protein [Nitrosophilus kaiyonis]